MLIQYTDSICWSTTLIQYADPIHWFNMLIQYTEVPGNMLTQYTDSNTQGSWLSQESLERQVGLCYSLLVIVLFYWLYNNYSESNSITTTYNGALIDSNWHSINVHLNTYHKLPIINIKQNSKCLKLTLISHGHTIPWATLLNLLNRGLAAAPQSSSLMVYKSKS